MESSFFDSSVFTLGPNELQALFPLLWLCVGLVFSTLAAGFRLGIGFTRVLSFFVFVPFVGLLAIQLGNPPVAVMGTALEMNAFTRLVGCAVGILALLVSTFVTPTRNGVLHPEWLAILVVQVLGLTLLPGARDWVSFFVYLETLAITGYVMASLDTDREKSLEAGLKYLLTGAFGSGFFLMGAALFYGLTGTLDFELIASALKSVNSGPEKFMALSAAILIISSLSFKLALFPLHMWAPDVYQASPTAMAAMLSTATKISVFGALAGIWTLTGFSNFPELKQILIGLAGLSIVAGSLLAMAQKSLRRLFAYSGIVNAGFAALALAAGPFATGSMFAYLFIYSVSVVGIFALLERFSTQLGLEPHGDLKIENLPQIGRKFQGIFVGIFAFFVFSIAGIPPLPGFFGKYLILKDLWIGQEYFSAGLLILGTLLGLGFYLKILVPLYMNQDEPTDEIPQNKRVAKLWPTALATTLCVLAAIYALGGLSRLPRWVETVEIFAR